MQMIFDYHFLIENNKSFLFYRKVVVRSEVRNRFNVLPQPSNVLV